MTQLKLNKFLSPFSDLDILDKMLFMAQITQVIPYTLFSSSLLTTKDQLVNHAFNTALLILYFQQKWGYYEANEAWF